MGSAYTDGVSLYWAAATGAGARDLQFEDLEEFYVEVLCEQAFDFDPGTLEFTFLEQAGDFPPRLFRDLGLLLLQEAQSLAREFELDASSGGLPGCGGWHGERRSGGGWWSGGEGRRGSGSRGGRVRPGEEASEGVQDGQAWLSQQCSSWSVVEERERHHF